MNCGFHGIKKIVTAITAKLHLSSIEFTFFFAQGLLFPGKQDNLRGQEWLD